MASVDNCWVVALVGVGRGSNAEKSTIEPCEVTRARKRAKNRGEIEATLRYAEGTLNLAQGKVTLELTPEFRFLDEAGQRPPI